MYKKSIFVFLCLLAAGSYAFGGAWSFQTNWSGGTSTGTTEDWFDGNNWSPQENEANPLILVTDCPLPPDWTAAAEMDQKTPDVCIAKSSPYYYGPDADGYDAACSQLCIHPWSWTGVTRQRVVVINAKVNCGLRINVCGHGGFYSGNQGYGLLDVNGTSEMYTPGLRNYDPNDPYDPELIIDPNYLFILGDGLWIGGGESGLNPNWGRVNIRDTAKIVVPKIQINYGDINIIGGLLKQDENDVNMADDRFRISLAWTTNDLGEPTNKINIIDGTLILQGDRQERVNYYVGKGRITAWDKHGMLTIGLDGEGNTVVTAVGDYNAAWNPNPNHMKINVNLTPTLTWLPGALVNSENLGSSTIAHAVYLGIDADAVANATTDSSEFMGYKNYNDPNSYAVTTALAAATDYFWRIDEYNDLHPDSPWTGYVWQFTTLGGSAVEPMPVSGTIGLPVPLQLDWLPGAFTVSHTLYFGTNEANVTDATPTNQLNAYIGTVSRPYTLGSLSFDLAKDTNYYWRIDEVNGASTWKSETWMFRNTNYFVVEDFNSYETSEDMNVKWVTGYSLEPTCWVTAQAGLQWSAMGGRLSFYYNNTATPYFSEARFITNSGSGSDWTGGGALPSTDPIVAVAIAYQGNASNTADPIYDRMYLGIEDTDGDVDVVLNTDANATRDVFGWSEWKVKLSDLGVPSPMAQASIKYFYVGVGERCGGFPGGQGTVLFDDVRLYQKSCEPDLNSIVGDFTRDCIVNYADLDMLVTDWLATGSTINLTMTAPVNNYIARYNFDASGGTTVADVTGNYTASVVFDDGVPVDDDKLWNTTGGYDGAGCINLLADKYVDINLPPALLDAGNTAGVFTIMCWIKFDYFAPTDTWPRLFAAQEPNDGGTLRESLEIECPGPRPPSADDGPRVFFNWKPTNAAGDGTDNNNLSTAANQMVTANFANQWNHYAFTFNSSTDKMRVYHNGYQVADGNATTHMMTHPATTFSIGNRVPGAIGEQHWYGSVDDVRFFTREVSAGEIAYIGSRNTGVYELLLDSVANINTTGTPQKVNFGDFAYMAQHWLEQTQWP